MRNFLMGICAAILLAGPVRSAIGDRWGFSDSTGADVIRLTSGSLGTSGAAGILEPGVNLGLDLGSSSLKFDRGYVEDLYAANTTFTGTGDYTGATISNVTMSRYKVGWTTVALNTTLTTASSHAIGCTNATAVITLQNATTAGAGYLQRVFNTSGAGNVSVASASTINGAASVNVTLNTGGVFISDGTAWWGQTATAP